MRSKHQCITIGNQLNPESLRNLIFFLDRTYPAEKSCLPRVQDPTLPLTLFFRDPVQERADETPITPVLDVVLLLWRIEQ